MALYASHFGGFNPPLKWVGGKAWLTPRLTQLYRPHCQKRLVEPFVGGLSVCLALRPLRALLADSNGDLINFYQWLQRGLQNTMVMLDARPAHRAAIARFNQLTALERASSREAALLFYYILRNAFSGVVTYKTDGSIQASYGGSDGTLKPHSNYVVIKQNLMTYAPVLKSWEFVHSSYQDLNWKDDDFIYADPPYDGVPYPYRHPFTWEHQIDLIKRLVAHPGPVVVSNANTDRIRALYAQHGFQLEFLKVKHTVGRRDDDFTKELLATRHL